jgi:tetratricopeptide (TPR) repeat protein
MLLTGCAARQARSLGSRFITEGEPAVDLGGPPVATSRSLHREMKKVQDLAARTPPHTSTFGATVEGSDKSLSAALLIETLLPTADSHLLVAREYERLGILDAAYSRLNLALVLEPKMSRAHEGLARIWRKWGFPASGLGPAYRAVAYDRGSASAQNTLGTVLDGLGRFDEARAAYREAAALAPDAGWALNNLCNLEYRLGRFEEARAYCESAIAVAPGLKAAHNNLALTFAATGDLVSARAEFLAAGDRATAEFNVGIVKMAEEDYVSAAQAFEEAIRARPGFTAAKTRAHTAKQRLLTGSR